MISFEYGDVEGNERGFVQLGHHGAKLNADNISLDREAFLYVPAGFLPA